MYHNRKLLSIVHRETPFRGQIISAEGAIEIKPAASVRSSTDHCSSSAGLTERTSDSWLESDDTPFGIYPEKGILPPGESVQCTLRFSPMGVLDYKAYLTCKYERNCDSRFAQRYVISSRLSFFYFVQ